MANIIVPLLSPVSVCLDSTTSKFNSPYRAIKESPMDSMFWPYSISTNAGVARSDGRGGILLFSQPRLKFDCLNNISYSNFSAGIKGLYYPLR